MNAQHVGLQGAHGWCATPYANFIGLHLHYTTCQGSGLPCEGMSLPTLDLLLGLGSKSMNGHCM